MTSTTLQVKKHSIFNLFKWTLRRNVPITLLYGILLLLIFPVVTLWQISTSSPYTDIAGTLEELAQFYYPATSAVVSFFAVLSAVFMFRFYTIGAVWICLCHCPLQEHRFLFPVFLQA